MSAAPHLAHNYHPLDVCLSRGEGSWVEDVDGRRYLDFLGAYSALNFGHRHPRLVAAATEQLGRLTLTSRAFDNDRLADFAAALADLCGMDLVLPMNTGAEAVETALKMARKWGYDVKGVPPDRARIVVMNGNFHGRTISIVSFSDDPDAHDGFGPHTPGFDRVPYGDAAALEAALTDDTVAVLLEPVQGEAGVLIPPDGYLAAVREMCTRHDVLMVADEIQSGLGRVGTTFALDHEGVRPDAYVLGKALGGGIVPLSAVVAPGSVLGVFSPGTHGSTFGGNPLAAAIGTEVVRMLREGEVLQRARELGEVFEQRLRALPPERVSAVRVRGLWAGLDVVDRTGRDVCEGLARRGVLAKDTHGSTLRLAPPLTTDPDDLALGLDRLAEEIGRG